MLFTCISKLAQTGLCLLIIIHLVVLLFVQEPPMMAPEIKEVVEKQSHEVKSIDLQGRIQGGLRVLKHPPKLPKIYYLLFNIVD